jgi:hypothetical protein
VTDDEITDATIKTATKHYKYGEEEFNYLVVGIITEQLGIDDELVTSELVDEWIRQLRLAIGNTAGYARAICRRTEGTPVQRPL